MKPQDIKNDYHFMIVEQFFPHISRNMILLWGTVEFIHYTDKLFFDTRDGTRRGFSYEIFGAIYSVVTLHDFVFPHLKPVKSISDYSKNQT